jgi:hypothetical protein
MSKTYQYRKHISWGQYILPGVASIFLILWIFIGVKLFHSSLSGQSSYPPNYIIYFILIIIGFSVILIAECVAGWYLSYRLAGVRITFENNVIVYKYRGGEKRINIESITSIKLPSIPYIGGWITIISGKEKIRLTVVVGAIDDFVQTLKAALDKAGLANRYNESKLFLFLKTAALSDQSWDRIYSFFWRLIFVTLGAGLLGFGIAKISRIYGLLWILISLIYPSLVCIVTEIIYGIRIAKNSIRETFSAPERDLAFEKSVYKLSAIVGSVFYFIMAIVIIFLHK